MDCSDGSGPDDDAYPLQDFRVPFQDLEPPRYEGQSRRRVEERVQRVFEQPLLVWWKLMAYFGPPVQPVSLTTHLKFWYTCRFAEDHRKVEARHIDVQEHVVGLCGLSL